MKPLLFSILLTLPLSLWGQTADALYGSYDYTNYREAAIFQETVTPETVDYRRLHAVLFFMTNEIRFKRGKTLLAPHNALEAAAYYHSKAMAEQGFFDHRNGKDRSRRTTEHRAKLAGVSNPYIAENIVYIYPDIHPTTYLSLATEMMKEWMESKGHKDNILAKEGLQLGCGVYYTNERWYGTQVFQWFESVKESEAKDKL